MDLKVRVSRTEPTARRTSVGHHIIHHSWGGRGGIGEGWIVRVFVDSSSAGVHEEVSHCGNLEVQLLGDSRLHFFAGAFCLLEYGHQRPPLDVCEHQSGFLWSGVFSLHLRVFSLTCWKRNKKPLAYLLQSNKLFRKLIHYYGICSLHFKLGLWTLNSSYDSPSITDSF